MGGDAGPCAGLSGGCFWPWPRRETFRGQEGKRRVARALRTMGGDFETQGGTVGLTMRRPSISERYRCGDQETLSMSSYGPEALGKVERDKGAHQTDARTRPASACVL